MLCMYTHNLKSLVSYFRPNHPENVTNCMTTIMILVIEEDDEVEIPIAECLLKHAKSELKVHIYVFNFLDINNMNLHSYPDKNIPSN